MAHAYLLQGHPERAIDEAVSAARRTPPMPPGCAAGPRRDADGDDGGGRGGVRPGARRGPSDSAAWTDVARFRRNSGEIGGAIAAADKAVDLDPRNVEALVLRGELTRGQYGLAAASIWFDRALEIDPEECHRSGRARRHPRRSRPR